MEGERREVEYPLGTATSMGKGNIEGSPLTTSLYRDDCSGQGVKGILTS